MILRLKISQKKCFLCGRGDKVSFNRPHSLHKTKRIVQPNLQKFRGKNYICTTCLRTLLKQKKS